MLEPEVLLSPVPGSGEGDEEVELLSTNIDDIISDDGK